ncbi:unnamed protein product [Auanema sp. JU1783]|nr:unnamed protein product [Auanema sp. JU1783]
MCRTNVFVLCVFQFIILSEAYLNESDHIYEWDSIEDVRNRIATYTEQKFAQSYHLWDSKDIDEFKKGIQKPALSHPLTLSRVRRDGGIVSGPIATAVVTGMIGMTANTVRELTNFHPSNSAGGCLWFGTAPFCNYPCPPEYDFIRLHNGRCSNFWMSSLCVPDDSFGKPCSTLLGSYFYKRFCCKSDPAECSWSGRWMGANTAHNIYCRYDNVGTCGAIDCSINHHTFKAQNASEVFGERCDKIKLFGMNGKATCGYIAWFDDDGQIIDSWYKTRV